MRHWFRVVLPPDWAVTVFAVAYLLAEGAYGLMFWMTQGRPPEGAMVPRDLVLIGAVIAYGTYRIHEFHPLYQKEYRQWLETSPWRFGQSLPNGPIHLVPQDGIVLLILFLLAQHQPFFHPAYVPLCFLIVYVACLANSFWSIGFAGYSYPVAFGLGLVIRLWNHWDYALVTAAALYPIAFVGLTRSLAAFPWNVPWYAGVSWTSQSWQELSRQHLESRQDQLLGWPFGRLQPQPPILHIRYRDGVLLSLLAGWWLYVVAALFMEKGMRPDSLRALIWFFSILLCCWLAAMRFTIYFWTHRPPISFWGRVFTLRWIIPGYDQMWVAPLCAVLVPSAAMAFLSWRSPFPVTVDFAIPLTLSLLILLNMGPTLERWHLTGQHRMVPGFTKQKVFPMLTGDFYDEMIEL